VVPLVQAHSRWACRNSLLCGNLGRQDGERVD
jgi:hypothetical protein